MKMLKINSVALLGAALVCVCGMDVAMAGAKYSVPGVVISRNADGSGYAEGTLGGVRNSTSTVERLRCLVKRTENVDSTGNVAGQVTFMSCLAINTNNEHVVCTSASDAVGNQLNGISSDSLITFYFDAAGTCTRVNVYSSSSLERKNP
jgi:hypothetical protein